MTSELFDKFVSSIRGTFLEEDRNSNFPSENTVPNTYQDLCKQLVDTWDEVMRTPVSCSQRRIDLCAKVEWIVSAARARLNGC